MAACKIEGCERKVRARGLCDKHYHRWHRHGDAQTNKRGTYYRAKDHPLYQIWRSMRQRCLNPNNRHHRRYGARGITVCDRWADFWKFVEDMGDRPSTRHSIDRINPNGNYEPANCRWATPVEQARNKELTKLTFEQAVEARRQTQQGRRKVDIAADLGVDYDAVLNATTGITYQPDTTDYAAHPSTDPRKRKETEKPPRQCEYPGCTDTEPYAKGLCRLHYRWLAESKTYADHKDRTCKNCGGDIIGKRIAADFCSQSCKMKYHRREGCYADDSHKPRCSVEGCERAVQAQGMCRTHYMRAWHHGDPLWEPPKYKPTPCATDGCESKAVARGLCMRCYARERKRGTLTTGRAQAHPSEG